MEETENELTVDTRTSGWLEAACSMCVCLPASELPASGEGRIGAFHTPVDNIPGPRATTGLRYVRRTIASSEYLAKFVCQGLRSSTGYYH